MILFSYFKEWRKNPQCSFSCCLALLLPLNDFQGKIFGVAGTNVVNDQLQTGQMDAPTIIGTVQDSGAIDVNLEEGDQEDYIATVGQEENCRKVKYKRKKSHKQNQTELFRLSVIVEETHLWIYVSIMYAKQGEYNG